MSDDPIELVPRWPVQPSKESDRAEIAGQTINYFTMSRPAGHTSELLRALADRLDPLPPHIILHCGLDSTSEGEVTATVYISFDSDEEGTYVTDPDG